MQTQNTFSITLNALGEGIDASSYVQISFDCSGRNLVLNDENENVHWVWKNDWKKKKHTAHDVELFNYLCF